MFGEKIGADSRFGGTRPRAGASGLRTKTSRLRKEVLGTEAGLRAGCLMASFLHRIRNIVMMKGAKIKRKAKTN